jgi:hypothetical protein
MPVIHGLTSAFLPRDIYYRPNYRQERQKPCLEVPRAHRS